jgi:hypothetical protein
LKGGLGKNLEPRQKLQSRGRNLAGREFLLSISRYYTLKVIKNPRLIKSRNMNFRGQCMATILFFCKNEFFS